MEAKQKRVKSVRVSVMLPPHIVEKLLEIVREEGYWSIGDLVRDLIRRKIAERGARKL
ncbi:MAG: ribbon-helix-helix protein, CopG family [Thermofilaceae archaeon]